MDDIKRILDSLSQSRVDDYKTWLEVGMALHASGESCALWENWSRKSAKFREGECQKRWATFGNYAGAPITIASVAKMAIDDGYKPSEGFGWDDPIGHSQTRKSPNTELKEYLSALFKSGDIVNFVVSSFEKDGKFLPCGKGVNKPFDELIRACNTYDDLGFILGDWNVKAGAWARINPMSGEGCKNSDVAEFRHCLIESDTLPKSEQLRKIRELNLPCSAIVDSGGKSVHAIVKIDAGKDEKLYRERVGELHSFLEKHGFPVDTACKNPSRLSRIAAVTRNGNRQRLIATNVGAKSFADWQKALNVPKYTIVPAGKLRTIDPNDMSDNILGNRFLCRNGSWLIVAQSGTHNSAHSKGVGGAEIGGKKNVLKISLVPDTYNAAHEYELPTKYFSGNGMLHKIRFSIYLPTTNPNITKIQLRLGSIAPASAGTIVSKTDNIDKSGVIMPKDEWQTVEMTLTLKWSGAFKLYLYKDTSSYFKLEEESADAVYLYSITCSCLQGFEGFFYGTGNSGFWKNHGASSRDLAFYGWSLPFEGNGNYTKHIAVSSFSNTTYLYAGGFPSGLELLQIVLRFDSELPDTSSAEDETQKNVFCLRTNDDTVYEEQLPAIPANRPYYIYPKLGFPELYYSLEIAPMYACNCGGSVDLIFTKVS